MAEASRPLPAAEIKRVIEAALLAAGEAVSVDRLAKLFQAGELPEEDPRGAVRTALAELEDDTRDRGFELKRVAGGYRFQVRQHLAAWVGRLFEERPPRYSRALLETLALIVYRQPVTRGDIEQVRGVAVSPNILRTLLEREWIAEVGHRETAGRPMMYGTTRTFLDDFNLRSLDELPPLPELGSMLEEAEASLDPAQADAVTPAQDEQSDSGAAAAAEQARPDDSRPLAEVVRLPNANR